jgi:hypothetical protein
VNKAGVLLLDGNVAHPIMSTTRWAFLLAAFASGVMAWGIGILARDPARNAFGRNVIKALETWWLRARWSQPAVARLQRMSIAGWILCAIMLVLFLIDPPRRY